MASATPETDHDRIRDWVEERGGRPACVKGTAALLRVDFGKPDEKLQEISWDDWFETFDASNLAALLPAGSRSRFVKLVDREANVPRGRGGAKRGGASTAARGGAARRKTAGAASRKGGKGAGRKATSHTSTAGRRKAAGASAARSARKAAARQTASRGVAARGGAARKGAAAGRVKGKKAAGGRRGSR